MTDDITPMPSLHGLIAHYTGVMQHLTNAHHLLRAHGTCAEHGECLPSDPGSIKAVESAVTDVARLVSKLVAKVETGVNVGVH